MFKFTANALSKCENDLKYPKSTQNFDSRCEYFATDDGSSMEQMLDDVGHKAIS